MRARRDGPTAVARFAARTPDNDTERVSVSVCDVACLSNHSGDSSETTVVTCASDGTVAMWRSKNVDKDASSATEEGRSIRGDSTVLGSHDGAVAVACSASRGVVASGGLDGRVRFWKMDARHSFAHPRYVRTHLEILSLYSYSRVSPLSQKLHRCVASMRRGALGGVCFGWGFNFDRVRR